MDEIRKSILEQFLAFPAAAKEPEELTDAERIALCIASGCKMDFRTEQTETGWKMVASTINPVGIVKIDGKFRVYERV